MCSEVYSIKTIINRLVYFELLADTMDANNNCEECDFTSMCEEYKKIMHKTLCQYAEKENE